MTVKKLKTTLEVVSYDDALLNGLLKIAQRLRQSKQRVLVACPKVVFDELNVMMGDETFPKDRLTQFVTGRSEAMLMNRFRGQTFDEVVCLVPEKDYVWVTPIIWSHSAVGRANSHTIVYRPKPKVK